MSRPSTRPSTAKPVTPQPIESNIPSFIFTIQSINDLAPVDHKEEIGGKLRSKYFDSSSPNYLPLNQPIDQSLTALVSPHNQSNSPSAKGKKKKEEEPINQPFQCVIGFPSIEALSNPLPTIQSTIPSINFTTPSPNDVFSPVIDHKHVESINSISDFLDVCHNQSIDLSVYQYFPPVTSSDKKKDDKKKKEAPSVNQSTNPSSSQSIDPDCLTLIGTVKVSLLDILKGNQSINQSFEIAIDETARQQIAILDAIKQAKLNQSASAPADPVSDQPLIRPAPTINISFGVSHPITSLADHQSSNLLTVNVGSFHQLPSVFSQSLNQASDQVEEQSTSAHQHRPSINQSMSPKAKAKKDVKEFDETFTVIYALPSTNESVQSNDQIPNDSTAQTTSQAPRIVWTDKCQLTPDDGVTDRSIEGTWLDQSASQPIGEPEESPPSARTPNNQSKPSVGQLASQPINPSITPSNASLLTPMRANPSVMTGSISQPANQSINPSLAVDHVKTSYLLPNSVKQLMQSIETDQPFVVQLSASRLQASNPPNELFTMVGVALVDCMPLMVPGETELSGYYAVHQINQPNNQSASQAKPAAVDDKKKVAKPPVKKPADAMTIQPANQETFDSCHTYAYISIKLAQPLVPRQSNPSIQEIVDQSVDQTTSQAIKPMSHLAALEPTDLSIMQKSQSMKTRKQLMDRLMVVAATMTQQLDAANQPANLLTNESATQLIDGALTSQGWMSTLRSFVEPLVDQLVNERFSNPSNDPVSQLDIARMRTQLMVELNEDISESVKLLFRTNQSMSEEPINQSFNESTRVLRQLDSLNRKARQAELFNDRSLARYHREQAIIVAQAFYQDSLDQSVAQSAIQLSDEVRDKLVNQSGRQSIIQMNQSEQKSIYRLIVDRARAALIDAWFLYASFLYRNPSADQTYKQVELALLQGLAVNKTIDLPCSEGVDDSVDQPIPNEDLPCYWLLCHLLLEQSMIETVKPLMDRLMSCSSHPLIDCLIVMYAAYREDDKAIHQSIAQMNQSLPFTAFDDIRTTSLIASRPVRQSVNQLASPNPSIFGARFANMFRSLRAAEIWLHGSIKQMRLSDPSIPDNQSISPLVSSSSDMSITDSINQIITLSVDQPSMYSLTAALIEYSLHLIDRHMLIEAEKYINHLDELVTSHVSVDQSIIDSTTPLEWLFIYGQLANLSGSINQPINCERWACHYLAMYEQINQPSIEFDGSVLERLIRIYLSKQQKVIALELMEKLVHRSTDSLNHQLTHQYGVRVLYMECLYLAARYEYALAQCVVASEIDVDGVQYRGWSTACLIKIWKAHLAKADERAEIEQRISERKCQISSSINQSTEPVQHSLQLQSLNQTALAYRNAALQTFESFKSHSELLPMAPVAASLSLYLELGLAFYERQMIEQAEYCWSHAAELEQTMTGKASLSRERLAWIDATKQGKEIIEGDREARIIQAAFRRARKAKENTFKNTQRILSPRAGSRSPMSKSPMSKSPLSPIRQVGKVYL